MGGLRWRVISKVSSEMVTMGPKVREIINSLIKVLILVHFAKLALGSLFALSRVQARESGMAGTS